MTIEINKSIARKSWKTNVNIQPDERQQQRGETNIGIKRTQQENRGHELEKGILQSNKLHE